MKQDFLQIRISENEKAELSEVIAQMNDSDMTVSQFVRDAVREKMMAIRERVNVIGVDVTSNGVTAIDGNGNPVDLEAA